MVHVLPDVPGGQLGEISGLVVTPIWMFAAEAAAGRTVAATTVAATAQTALFIQLIEQDGDFKVARNVATAHPSKVP